MPTIRRTECPWKGCIRARLIDEHAAGALDHGGALWLLLVFEGFLVSEAAGAAGLAAAA